MFKAFTVDYSDIPADVNLDAFETGGVSEYYDDYLVVQVDGKTIYCKPVSGLARDNKMIMDLMDLAYYLGVMDGIKHDQGFMRGRTLKMLDTNKHQTRLHGGWPVYEKLDKEEEIS